jgi:hypothetical protein
MALLRAASSEEGSRVEESFDTEAPWPVCSDEFRPEVENPSPWAEQPGCDWGYMSMSRATRRGLVVSLCEIKTSRTNVNRSDVLSEE